MDRYDTLLENYRNAWAGLRMIRNAVEELGPVGVLPSQEAVIGRYGPEPIHEAQAIVEALASILGDAAGKAVPQSSPLDSGGIVSTRPAASRPAMPQRTAAVAAPLRRERRRHPR
jgi:hypothetical protein